MDDKTGSHGTVQHTVDKMQDAIAGMAGRATASTVSTADAFVKNAAVADLYEIRAARLALQRSSSPQVKAIASEMINDHTTSIHQLKAALEMNETKGIPPPPQELDTRREKMVEHLNAAPEDKFDTTYLDQQILAHQEALALLLSYRDKGDNPQLRSVAAGAAPVVYGHLQQMKALKPHLPS